MIVRSLMASNLAVRGGVGSRGAALSLRGNPEPPRRLPLALPKHTCFYCSSKSRLVLKKMGDPLQ